MRAIRCLSCAAVVLASAPLRAQAPRGYDTLSAHAAAESLKVIAYLQTFVNLPAPLMRVTLGISHDEIGFARRPRRTDVVAVTG